MPASGAMESALSAIRSAAPEDEADTKAAAVDRRVQVRSLQGSMTASLHRNDHPVICARKSGGAWPLLLLEDQADRAPRSRVAEDPAAAPDEMEDRNGG